MDVAAMERNKVRLAVVSDLHYTQFPGSHCRPAAATQGVEYDPISALIDYIKSKRGHPDEWAADYLLCPGDITDKASVAGFKEGWSKLILLKECLGAEHLLASTGNHEVDSRANETHDGYGNVEAELDPLKHLQECPDYPSSIWNGLDRQWVYWGRGYEFIDTGSVLFLLINSSHYHQTTRKNEFERGRIGDLGIDLLRAEIEEKVNSSRASAFVVLLHHHPVNHENLDISLGRIEMTNGARLIEVLAESGVSWLIVHGHKHHGRVLLTQGSGCQSVVIAAGSAGALLSGKHGINCRLQAYLIEIDSEGASISPSLKGHIRALSWFDNQWQPAFSNNHGIPDGSGFSFPAISIDGLVHSILGVLNKQPGRNFVTWDELRVELPSLRYLMPGQLRHLKAALEKASVRTTWPDAHYFPKEISL
ncbi:metallophosphoesterase family protein [Lysobacter sp. 1R34A]|uniref:metallophosphoesterase family protein n=1 Tax=Lysobacter sp. 1R34A TaxID=3445786 RepID=UPI003EEDF294